MSNTWHPDESELTAFADGELGSFDGRRVETHVTSCGECSDRVRDHREFLAEYREVRREVLPAPPLPWSNLRPQLRQKSQKTFPLRVPLRWMAAAAALVIGVFLLQTTGSRTLNAAELLRDAIVAQKRSPVQVRDQKKRIRVKTRHAEFVRSGNATSAEEARVARLFLEARFPWDEPLNPASFAEWRDGLAHKDDQVRELPGRLYRIATSTKDGLLEEASITLRAADMQAVESTFRFGTDDYVEISEAPAVAAPEHTAVAAQPYSRADAPVPVTPAGPSDELRVVAAIHAIQADLGDPVEITRDDSRGRVVVSALGADSDRQAQLRAAVSSLSFVELRFEQPDAVRGSVAPALERRSAGAPVPPSKPSELQDRLAAQLGGRTTAENFTNHVMDLSESALARAHALRTLARRFPPAVESQLTAGDVAVLRKIEEDHTRALAASVRQMNEVIRPVVNSGASFGAATVGDYDSWQAGAENVLGAAREVDQVLTRALAGNASGIDPDEALSKLGRAAADLQARVAALRTTVARAR